MEGSEKDKREARHAVERRERQKRERPHQMVLFLCVQKTDKDTVRIFIRRIEFPAPAFLSLGHCLVKRMVPWAKVFGRYPCRWAG